MRTSTLTDRLTFPKATILVVAAMVFTNGIWHLLGKPAEKIPHWVSPSVLICDLIAVIVGIILILRYRARHYRVMVIVYTMLLANLMAVIRTLILHR